jgi:molybdopterin synthase catalytic subunit
MSVEVQILDGPLTRPAAVWHVAIPGAEVGAVVLFEGSVRPTEQGEPIAALDYEAYEPMASNMLRTLAAQAIDHHGVLAVSVEHSRGRVPAGACSFRLRLAARHSKPCIAAMNEFLDHLKKDVPIWKSVVKEPE